MRVWIEGDKSRSFCIRCGAKDYNELDRVVHITKPQLPKRDVASYIWNRTLPLSGTVAEKYLISRHCDTHSENIRYLPPSSKYQESALIAKFNGNSIQLIKLREDATKINKIILGPSKGLHIEVSDYEGENLIITEGLEDAISCAMATGWSAWATGGAANIANVIPKNRKVFLIVDEDMAGLGAMKRVVEKVIPIRIGRIFGSGMDANDVLIDRGKEALLAAIEWSELQHQARTGAISFSAMHRKAQWALSVIGT